MPVGAFAAGTPSGELGSHRWGGVMKRILCSTVAYAAIVVGSANAADLFRKAPVSAEPEVVSLWSGFYVGGHIGAGWGTKEQTFFLL
jgi:hypothetical protein